MEAGGGDTSVNFTANKTSRRQKHFEFLCQVTFLNFPQVVQPTSWELSDLFKRPPFCKTPPNVSIYVGPNCTMLPYSAKMMPRMWSRVPSLITLVTLPPNSFQLKPYRWPETPWGVAVGWSHPTLHRGGHKCAHSVQCRSAHKPAQCVRGVSVVQSWGGGRSTLPLSHGECQGESYHCLRTRWLSVGWRGGRAFDVFPLSFLKTSRTCQVFASRSWLLHQTKSLRFLALILYIQLHIHLQQIVNNILQEQVAYCILGLTGLPLACC